jgi:hypothetical protein
VFAGFVSSFLAEAGRSRPEKPTKKLRTPVGVGFGRCVSSGSCVSFGGGILAKPNV